MANGINEFLEYMDEHLTALPDEVATFGQAQIDAVVRSGKVGRAPLSVHRDAGSVYWRNLTVVVEGLESLSERVLPYCGSTRDVPLIGSVDNIVAHEDNLGNTLATLALVRAREKGKLTEYDRNGHSYFVVPEMEKDPRVKNFFRL